MFYNKKKYIASGSLSSIAWKRFIRNKLSLASLLLIVFITLTAILGYLISPDSTPFANEQHLELTTKKPGFSIKMLKIVRPEQEQHSNFIHKMFYGQRSTYITIPIFKYHFHEDKLVYETYSGATPNDGDTIIISLAKVIYPISNDHEIKTEGNFIIFTDINGVNHRESIPDLQKKITEDYLINKRFILGTDRYGRDVLSQLIIGTRVSLSVGFISVLISLVIGILLGALSGFFKGWVDNLIVWFINVVWSIPTLLLVIAITFALGKGFWQVFIAVGLTMWVEVARVVRGQILSIREKEFVEAGRALGFKNSRIIFRHILPNVMGAVIVISAANFASAILMEAGLSFLGIGVQPPMPSWGMMIKENYGYIILDAAYLAILPGLAIMIVVLAFMIMGNGLRDALDVKIEQ